MTTSPRAEVVEVLVRAADAGDTYLTWRWLDDLNNPGARRLDTSRLTAVLQRLDHALVAPLPGETREYARTRAMTEGAFVDGDRERTLAGQLANAVELAALVDGIAARRESGRRVRVRLTPSPRLARIPWEALAVGEAGERLLDVADVVYDPPATVRLERSVSPVSWQQRADLPAIFVIDPRTGTAELPSILVADETATKDFKSRVKGYLEKGLADPDNVRRAVSRDVKRSHLSRWLGPDRSRLYYFGHVSSEPDEPGSASLHLSDNLADRDTWGMASPRGAHLPLSALDLLLGTTVAPVERRTDRETQQGVPGHELWPMPPRVAVIACEGGADFRSIETFGLVIAMLNAGAELVTTTRWTMPTDVTLWRHHKALETEGIRPTIDLALAVDTAHSLPDPLAELAKWQRQQLNSWRADGDVAHTPLLWASLINTWAPAVSAAPVRPRASPIDA